MPLAPAAIVFVSNYVKERFISHYRTDAQTVVIPHGVDHGSCSLPVEPFDGQQDMTIAVLAKRVDRRRPYVVIAWARSSRERTRPTTVVAA